MKLSKVESTRKTQQMQQTSSLYFVADQISDLLSCSPQELRFALFPPTPLNFVTVFSCEDAKTTYP